VPDAGRDVQCSNCGNTWFQKSTRVDADLAAEMGFELTTETPEMPDAAASHFDEPQVPDFGPEYEDDAAPAPVAPETDTPDFEVPDFEGQHADEDAFEDEPAPIMDAQPRSAVSDSVRDILRAEVAFDNTSHPKTGGASLETQPELGLQDGQSNDRRQGLRERMARLRGLDPSDTHGAPSPSGKRRDMLPDIEEINSTLSASSERDDDGTVPDVDTRKTRAQRSSFRVTFALLIIAASLLVLLYILAPMLSANIPFLQAPLEAYVETVNVFRAWLDGTMRAASLRLDALLGQLNGSAE
jgi:hypothetical protein